MIEILPLKDKEVLEKLNQKENTNANFAFCVYNSQKIDGYILYNVSDSCGHIILVNSQDSAIFDGLVRAVLASLYDFSINQATFSDSIDINLLRELKIINQDETMVKSIKKILYKCDGCNCGC